MPDADSPQDEAREAYHQALRLTKEGHYQEALEKHLWLHEHVPASSPWWAGVQLSSVLSHWVRLGGVFPPALEALKKLRQAKTDQLLADAAGWQLLHDAKTTSRPLDDDEKEMFNQLDLHRGLFYDIKLINQHLEVNEATLELFKQLDASWPGVATLNYFHAEKFLIEAGELTLVRKHLSGIFAMFKLLKSNLKDAGESEVEAEEARKSFEECFITSTVDHIQRVVQAGEVDLAREIQSMALAVLDSPAIRTASLTPQPVVKHPYRPSAS